MTWKSLAGVEIGMKSLWETRPVWPLSKLFHGVPTMLHTTCLPVEVRRKACHQVQKQSSIPAMLVQAKPHVHLNAYAT